MLQSWAILGRTKANGTGDGRSHNCRAGCSRNTGSIRIRVIIRSPAWHQHHLPAAKFRQVVLQNHQWRPKQKQRYFRRLQNIVPHSRCKARPGETIFSLASFREIEVYLPACEKQEKHHAGSRKRLIRHQASGSVTQWRHYHHHQPALREPWSGSLSSATPAFSALPGRQF